MIPLLVDYSSPTVSSDQKSVLRHSHGLLDIFIYWNLQFLNNVIINKTKVLLLQPKGDFDFIVSKFLNYLGFQSFNFERSWWRVFQKDVERTFDIYVFIGEDEQWYSRSFI